MLAFLCAWEELRRCARPGTSDLSRTLLSPFRTYEACKNFMDVGLAVRFQCAFHIF